MERNLYFGNLLTFLCFFLFAYFGNIFYEACLYNEL